MKHFNYWRKKKQRLNNLFKKKILTNHKQKKISGNRWKISVWNPRQEFTDILICKSQVRFKTKTESESQKYLKGINNWFLKNCIAIFIFKFRISLRATLRIIWIDIEIFRNPFLRLLTINWSSANMLSGIYTQ